MIEVGGAGTLERSLATVRTGGRIAYIGVLSGLGAQANPVALIPKRQWRDATYEALASKSRTGSSDFGEGRSSSPQRWI